MPRRKSDTRMLSVPCSAEEAEAIAEMKALCGLGSDADLVRTALWNLSEHLDMNIDLRLGVFDLRPLTGRNGYDTGTQVRTVKEATKRGERTRAKQKPAADHPWRLTL